MRARGIVCFVLALGLVADWFVPASAQENKSVSLREVLTLAGVDPARLVELPEISDFAESDWLLVLQVLSRLEQFRTLPASTPSFTSFPAVWLETESRAIGESFDIQGKILSVDRITLPEGVATLADKDEMFACRFMFAEFAEQKIQTVEVLTSQIPRAWRSKTQFDEPVSLRCALVKASDGANTRAALVVTNHLAWYPAEGAPTGQMLLAQHGMDVALLDEVVHRQPFVKPEISREGEAFYAGLQALSETDLSELTRLARENVPRVANEWRTRKPELVRDHLKLAEQLDKTKASAEREPLALKVRRAKSRRDLATTIARQADKGQSSVATMFLQPEKKVGELFLFEGTARRAVWIAAEDQGDFTGYYEMEVYPIEARLLDNRPVVCCITSLPEGFPVGDQIREPVQIAGVFFKSWRYRSRNLIQREGQTEQPRQLYTPVMLAKAPVWRTTSLQRDSRGALWGGLAFLGALAAVWAGMAWLSRRDRSARNALRPTETINIENR